MPPHKYGKKAARLESRTSDKDNYAASSQTSVKAACPLLHLPNELLDQIARLLITELKRRKYDFRDLQSFSKTCSRIHTICEPYQPGSVRARVRPGNVRNLASRLATDPPAAHMIRGLHLSCCSYPCSCPRFGQRRDKHVTSQDNIVRWMQIGDFTDIWDEHNFAILGPLVTMLPNLEYLQLFIHDFGDEPSRKTWALVFQTIYKFQSTGRGLTQLKHVYLSIWPKGSITPSTSIDCTDLLRLPQLRSLQLGFHEPGNIRCQGLPSEARIVRIHWDHYDNRMIEEILATCTNVSYLDIKACHRHKSVTLELRNLRKTLEYLRVICAGQTEIKLAPIYDFPNLKQVHLSVEVLNNSLASADGKQSLYRFLPSSLISLSLDELNSAEDCRIVLEHLAEIIKDNEHKFVRLQRIKLDTSVYIEVSRDQCEESGWTVQEQYGRQFLIYRGCNPGDLAELYAKHFESKYYL